MTQPVESGRELARLVSNRAAARLRAFRKDVELALPGLVERVVLFGSRARGDGRPDSDYDVAVLLGDGKPPVGLGHLLSDIAYPHVRAGIPIRAVAVPARHVNAGSPASMARNIARDGVVIL